MTFDLVFYVYDCALNQAIKHCFITCLKQAVCLFYGMYVDMVNMAVTKLNLNKPLNCNLKPTKKNGDWKADQKLVKQAQIEYTICKLFVCKFCLWYLDHLTVKVSYHDNIHHPIFSPIIDNFRLLFTHYAFI